MGRPDNEEGAVIIVGGRFEVDPVQRAEFVVERIEMMRRSRAEHGCIEYTFAEDPLDPGVVILFERWESQEDLDEHLAAVSSTTTSVVPTSASITIYDVAGERPLR
jgi:quinol monooxygenase YgiN